MRLVGGCRLLRVRVGLLSQFLKVALHDRVPVLGNGLRAESGLVKSFLRSGRSSHSRSAKEKGGRCISHDPLRPNCLGQ